MATVPIRLTTDNFTPATRTPWGGSRIVSRYKPRLRAAGLSTDTVVGEAWEFSATPEFPSRTMDGLLVRECISRDPVAWLGREAPRGGTGLLLKWIDSQDKLSLQIHPPNDHPGLAPGETGKPESWYIVEADDGAGLYLGLQPGVDRQRMQRALSRGDGSAAELLRFLPVEPGDFFVLEPGMPHAIGEGITLIEPQFVTPGQRGVTYRYWDWDRRYDADGHRDPAGEPRALHVEEALAVTDFAAACDDDFVRRHQLRAGPADLSAPAATTPLCGPAGTAPIVSDHLEVARCAGRGPVPLPTWNALRVVTVVAGDVQLGDLSLTTGDTAAVPAACQGLELNLNGALAIVAAAL